MDASNAGMGGVSREDEEMEVDLTPGEVYHINKGVDIDDSSGSSLGGNLRRCPRRDRCGRCFRRRPVRWVSTDICTIML